MSDDTWVKIFRKMKEWEWYDHVPTKVLFIHILLSVNYSPSKYQNHVIPSGSMVSGLNTLSEQTGLSVQQVRTALQKLKKTKEITIKPNNKFSIISVIKWDDHQGDNKQITNEQQTNNKQITTSKEGKKVRTKEKNTVPKPESISDNLWSSFLVIRKEKKLPLTPPAFKAITREGEKLGWPIEKTIERCCEQGWAGFKAKWIDNDEQEEQPRRQASDWN